MTTRSFIIEPADNVQVEADKPIEIRGIAFSGGHGIKEVLVSSDGGRSWAEAGLGEDKGKYSWRQWSLRWKPPKPGRHILMVRATDDIGGSQPFEGLWNPAGYLWNKIEKTEVVAR
jgi:hypothetical protein